MAAVIFVTTTTILNYAIWHGLLKKGALTWLAGESAAGVDLSYLQYIVFIAVIAAFVQFVEMFAERFSPALYYALGIFLPLITVNCAILGAALFMVIRQYGFAQSAGFGLGAGVGWALAITMVITGVMALAFMGFAGMVTIQ